MPSGSLKKSSFFEKNSVLYLTKILFNVLDRTKIIIKCCAPATIAKKLPLPQPPCHIPHGASAGRELNAAHVALLKMRLSPVTCSSASRMSIMLSLIEVEVLLPLESGLLDAAEMNPMPTRGSPSPSDIAQNGQRQLKNITPNEHGQLSVHVILSRIIKRACF